MARPPVQIRVPPVLVPALVPALIRAAVLLVVLAAGSGCDSGAGRAGKAEPGPVPISAQRPGDPRRGYDLLVDRATIPCGLPYDAYLRGRARAGLRPGQNAGPQFPGRTSRNWGLPYGLTLWRSPSGVDLVTTNCLACHAAPLDGRLVMGLGNAFIDLTRDPLIPVAAAEADLRGPAQQAEWRRWAGRVTALADTLQTDTLGVSPSHHLIGALAAHRDPVTLAWSNQPRFAQPAGPPPPAAIPPLWNLGRKHALFHNAEGRGDQARHLLLPALTCIESAGEAEAQDAAFRDIRAYLATLAAPPYPYGIDPGLAAQGRRVYQSACRGCHGGDDGSYPNRVIALGAVGTDPALARAADADSDAARAWFQQSFVGQLARSVPALGYLAPPLAGVWATAPYLHNDSVPTLAALLESRSRPRFWRLRQGADGAPRYDPVGLGWEYQPLPAGKSAAMSWDERERIYDSSLPGYGNAGHTEGDGLSPESRRALLEYLKTL